MPQTKTMICVTCPVGCEMTVEYEDGSLVSVSGNTCKRGAAFAADEITNPRRTLTSTVKIRTAGGKVRFLPVKTSRPVQKSLLIPAMREIAAITLDAPVKMGDVVRACFTEEGIDLVAGRDLP